MTITYSPDYIEMVDRQGARALFPQIQGHYVYILHRSNGEPFYVGKGGWNDRALQHEDEAKNRSKISHKLNVIRSMHKRGKSVLYSLHGVFATHEEALSEEKLLIKIIGRFDLGSGPLTNQTDGGEGTLNPSEESKERHRQTLSGENAEDPDRIVANNFFSKFCGVASTPIKPLSSYEHRVETLHRNMKHISMTPRNAGALIAMSVAQSVPILAGTEMSRRFRVNEVDMILENGCGRNMLVNEMIELVEDTPRHEIFCVTAGGAAFIRQYCDKQNLINYGVMEV
jgi:hypothetical protein